jgi:hypothetical protein
VDAVEALSGYDLLALLRDDIEAAVESRHSGPPVALDGPFTAPRDSRVSMSAAGSTRPDAVRLTYLWSFGDGNARHRCSRRHTYAQDGGTR